MKILYIANHGNGHNDDEGAITYALQQLRHSVERIHERHAGVQLSKVNLADFSFCLFHKFSDLHILSKIREQMPTVFWYFDRVGSDNDPSLIPRMTDRTRWMMGARKVASLGFCTDGDWVAEAPKGAGLCQLLQLTQGFDERQYVPLDDPSRRERTKHHRFIFPGTLRRCGRLREEWFKLLAGRYGNRFRHMVESFGADLTKEVDESLFAICPPFPVSDRYYSNRIYNLMGRGAYVLHPYSKRAADEYRNVFHFQLYNSESHMLELIDSILSQPDSLKGYLQAVGGNAQIVTMRNHTYLRRCCDLVDTVKIGFGI